MNQQAKIEHLKSSDIPEMLELSIQAFKDFPFITAFQIGPELNELFLKVFLKASLDLCKGMKDRMWYGIREKGRLICASISVPASFLEKASMLLVIRFIFSILSSFFLLIRLCISILRTIGWRKAKELGDFFKKVFYKEKPRYKEPYLELGLLATLPEYQKQGVGRKMLHFLYEEAKNKGYKGVILNTTRDTPAFRLYLKEGFSVEKEFTIDKTTISWLRLTFKS